jgi:hypothetical protein
VVKTADLLVEEGSEEACARRIVACLTRHGIAANADALVASLVKSPSQVASGDEECLWAVIRLTLVSELGLDARDDEALMEALKSRYIGVTQHALVTSNVMAILGDVVEHVSNWRRNGDSMDQVANVLEGALTLLMPFPLLDKEDLTNECGGHSRLMMLALALLVNVLDGTKRIEIAMTRLDEKDSAEQRLLLQQANRIQSLERELREREQAVEEVAREVAARLQHDGAGREKLAATEQCIVRLTEELQHMERETSVATAEYGKLLEENKSMAESAKQYDDRLVQARVELDAARMHHEHCERERRVQRRLFEDLTVELDRRERAVAGEAKRLEEQLAALVNDANAAKRQVEQERDLVLLELVASRHAQSMLEQELSSSRAAAKELETELSIRQEAQRVHDEEMDRSMELESQNTDSLKLRLSEEAERALAACKERDEAHADLVALREEHASALDCISSQKEKATERERELRTRLHECELAAGARVQKLERESKSREKKARRGDRKRVAELEEIIRAADVEKEKAVAKAKEEQGKASVVAAKEAELRNRVVSMAKQAQGARVRHCAWTAWWVVLALCFVRVFFAPTVQV